MVPVLLAGGDGSSPVGTQCGSPTYIILLILVFPLMFGACSLVAMNLYKKTQRKLACPDYPWMDGDIRWTPYLLVKTSLLCISGGIASGFLGVGGGMLIGPVFLHINMAPFVATTTASFMILFTATSTTTQYIIYKKIQYEFSLWYASVGFISSIIGQLVISYLIKKYKKQSIVAFLLSFVVLVSLAFFIWVSVDNIKGDKASGISPWQFSSPCDQNTTTTNSSSSTALFFSPLY